MQRYLLVLAYATVAILSAGVLVVGDAPRPQEAGCLAGHPFPAQP